ncbi:MAG: SAM-dependent methyltransferase [Clostridia bacterium]|nr:SAM-dependent methyltransferase [Clostridia bacterium]
MAEHRLTDARLCSAIPYLTKGGRVADIGTDHAYLPIHLVAEGIVREALACDINEGPIESARANIREAGLEAQISTLRTDGLCGVEAFAPDDILIFGMGGELIVRILSDAPWIRREGIGLVLQPMSRASVLRKWLAEEGFSLLGETLTQDGRKFYQTIHARWSGRPTVLSEEEALLGRLPQSASPELLRAFLAHEIAVRERILRGKSLSAVADGEKEQRELQFLRERLEIAR